MISVRKAQDKDIKRVTELLGQVLELHADLRPDLFIHGTAGLFHGESPLTIRRSDGWRFAELSFSAGAYSALY